MLIAVVAVVQLVSCSEIKNPGFQTENSFQTDRNLGPKSKLEFSKNVVKKKKGGIKKLESSVFRKERKKTRVFIFMRKKKR